MQKIHAKRRSAPSSARAGRGSLAWLLCLGALSAGCEEWWGEGEDDPDLDAGMSPSVPGDAAVDGGSPLADAGFPLADAGPAPDGAVVLPDAAADAGAALDAAPALDTGLLDAAPDAAAEAGPDAAVPDAAVPDAAPATELPCDVAQVLRARCQSCHGDPPVGAPIKLVTLADLRAASAAGGFVYQRVQVRIDSNTMPPSWTTTGALTNSEKATLTSWISAGAPGSSGSCP